MAAQLPGGLVAVHFGHLHVHEHRVEGLGLGGGFHGGFHGQAAVGGNDCPHVPGLQGFAGHQLVQLVVFGHQHPQRLGEGRQLNGAIGGQPGCVGHFQRQLEPERGAPARLALHLQPAAVQLHQAAGNAQPQPGAAKLPGGSGVGLRKILENGFQLVHRDADAGVLDGKAQPAGGGRRGGIVRGSHAASRR